MSLECTTHTLFALNPMPFFQRFVNAYTGLGDSRCVFEIARVYAKAAHALSPATTALCGCTEQRLLPARSQVRQLPHVRALRAGGCVCVCV